MTNLLDKRFPIFKVNEAFSSLLLNSALFLYSFSRYSQIFFSHTKSWRELWKILNILLFKSHFEKSFFPFSLCRSTADTFAQFLGCWSLNIKKASDEKRKSETEVVGCNFGWYMSKRKKINKSKGGKSRMNKKSNCEELIFFSLSFKLAAENSKKD